MKPKINLLGICGIALALLIGLIGCGEDAIEEDPVNFVQAIPTTGSEIQQDATIIATFDGTPDGVNVKGGKFSVSGSNVRITGPFAAGALNLMITWSDGATTLTYTVEAPEPAPAGMVLIPAGEFDMGSNDAEAQNNEQPVHRVYVDAFYMDETEVTNVQFKEFLLENPQWQKGRVNHRKFADPHYLLLWNGNNYPDGEGNHPVVFVSWYAAMAYSEWAGKRLPTEAEWEYAARGGLKGKKYPTSNTITALDANFNRNANGTTPVSEYPENGYKLYDMAGNVWEWCLDEYDAEFYFTFPRNGVARNPLSGANSVEWLMNNWTNVVGSRVLWDGSWHNVGSRVLRGGSWPDNAVSARVAFRLDVLPRHTNGHIGFRCVRAVSP